MQLDGQTLQVLSATKIQKDHFRTMATVWLLTISALSLTAFWMFFYLPLPPYAIVILGLLGGTAFGFSLYYGISNVLGFRKTSELLQTFDEGWERLSQAVSGGTSAALASAMKTLKEKQNNLLQSIIEHREEYLKELIDIRYRAELQSQLEQEIKQFEEGYLQQVTNIRNQHPLYKAYYALESSENYLKQRRVEIEKQWDEAMSKTSWWNQIKYAGSLDFKDLDKNIREIDTAKRLLLRKYEQDFGSLNIHYGKLAKQAFERVAKTKISSEEFIQQCQYEDSVGQDVLKKGYFFAFLSIPVSLWSDVTRAGDIYDVLRSVNGNYAGMSDAEIWWESLFLQPESLAGLISLTKGAYLERLVAEDTGGQLFEHFNHPDTDIVIDGVAFQIKSTDSVDYIHSVSDGVPIIATTEVANLTGAIDSGYSNEDLHEVVSLAIGGAVIDAGDTAVDAILSGVGGLGVFATLEGISHAVKKHENGGDPIEAMFEGAGVAIEGTARAAVNTMELGYKVLSSRPSRFVGRGLLKVFIALDNKLMAAGQSDNKR